jgi:hypothetical protein
MNNFVSGLLIAIIGGGIVALAGYLLIVKENQMEIASLKSTISDLKMIATDTQKSLNATRLFIAQAHPDRDLAQRGSVEKLRGLSTKEIEELADSLPQVQLTNTKEVESVPVSIQNLMEKYNWTEGDVGTYYEIAELPTKEGTM